MFLWHPYNIFGRNSYQINIRNTKNISSREDHSISVIVKHRSAVEGSYDILYIYISQGGCTKTLSHNWTEFMVPPYLSYTIPLIYLWIILLQVLIILKSFITPYSSSTASTSPSIYVIVALIWCILICIQPWSSQ